MSKPLNGELKGILKLSFQHCMQELVNFLSRLTPTGKTVISIDFFFTAGSGSVPAGLKQPHCCQPRVNIEIFGPCNHQHHS